MTYGTRDCSTLNPGTWLTCEPSGHEPGDDSLDAIGALWVRAALALLVRCQPVVIGEDGPPGLQPPLLLSLPLAADAAEQAGILSSIMPTALCRGEGAVRREDLLSRRMRLRYNWSVTPQNMKRAVIQLKSEMGLKAELVWPDTHWTLGLHGVQLVRAVDAERQRAVRALGGVEVGGIPIRALAGVIGPLRV